MAQPNENHPSSETAGRYLNDSHKEADSFKDFIGPNFVVKRIQKREGFYFFYAGVDPEIKTDYKPYELVKIVNKANPSLVKVVVLQSCKGLKGIELSEILAHNLKVAVGDQIYFEPIQNPPGVGSLTVSKIALDVAPIVEENTQDYLRDYDNLGLDYNYYRTYGEKKPEKENGHKALLDYVKKTFRYSYITDEHQFCFENSWYKLTVNENKKLKHFLVLPTTKITVHTDAELLGSNDIIGLEEPYRALKECITWPNYYANQYQKLKIEPSKGILLTGPAGCGKTHLMRQISKSTNLHFIHIKGPEIISKYVGGSEKELRKIFETAKKNEPSLIFFDEIDALGTKRTAHAETESRIVAQLLTLMDGLQNRGNVIVVAATNQPDLLDSSLRRPGRFDKEIVLKPPTIGDRKKLFDLFLRSTTSGDGSIDTDVLAERTPGFVHADIKFLVNQAKINVIRRLEKNPKDTPTVTMLDFETGINKMDPSVLRQHYLLKDSKKTLDQIIGYDYVKEKIFEQIYLPKKYPHLFKNNALKKIKGILLQGPPGTGKTSLAKALASELDYNFLTIVASDITSKYVGEPEQRIRELFKKACLSAPCVLFLDEIDAIFGSSDKLKNLAAHDLGKTGQLLAEMDGALSNEADIILIGTTNKAKYLDPALLRSGRFELILTMDYPTLEELNLLYHYNFDKLTNIKDFSTLLQKSKNLRLTGSDLEAIKKLAVFNYLKNKDPVELKNLEDRSEKQYQPLDIGIADIELALNQLVKNRLKTPFKVDLTN